MTKKVTIIVLCVCTLVCIIIAALFLTNKKNNDKLADDIMNEYTQEIPEFEPESHKSDTDSVSKSFNDYSEELGDAGDITILEDLGEDDNGNSIIYHEDATDNWKVEPTSKPLEVMFFDTTKGEPLGNEYDMLEDHLYTYIKGKHPEANNVTCKATIVYTNKVDRIEYVVEFAQYPETVDIKLDTSERTSDIKEVE